MGKTLLLLPSEFFPFHECVLPSLPQPSQVYHYPKRHPGPVKPHYGIPAEEWPAVLRRVVENQEPLRQVANDYGVSYETVRRTVMATRQQSNAGS
jgi:hypothetical protein